MTVFGDQNRVFGGGAEHCLVGRALVGQIAVDEVIGAVAATAALIGGPARGRRSGVRRRRVR